MESTVIQSQGAACSALFDRIRHEKARSGRTTMQIVQDTGVPKTTLDRFFAGTRSTLPFPLRCRPLHLFWHFYGCCRRPVPAGAGGAYRPFGENEEQVEPLRERSRMME